MQEEPSLSAGPSHRKLVQDLRNDQHRKLSDESRWRSASITVSLMKANSQYVGFLEIVSFSLPHFLFASRLQQSFINCGLMLFRHFSGNKSSPTEQGVLQQRHNPEGEREISLRAGLCLCPKALAQLSVVPRPGADLHPPHILELSTPVPSLFQGLIPLLLVNSRYKVSAAES